MAEAHCRPAASWCAFPDDAAAVDARSSSYTRLWLHAHAARFSLYDKALLRTTHASDNVLTYSTKCHCHNTASCCSLTIWAIYTTSGPTIQISEYCRFDARYWLSIVKVIRGRQYRKFESRMRFSVSEY